MPIPELESQNKVVNISLVILTREHIKHDVHHLKLFPNKNKLVVTYKSFWRNELFFFPSILYQPKLRIGSYNYVFKIREKNTDLYVPN